MQVKAKILRRHIIEMISAANSGHAGGSLSAVEIITALYFHELRHDPKNPDWPERDRFILSKGHAAPVLYAALAEAGYFPVSELATLRKMDSRMQGHCDVLTTPGIETSSGDGECDEGQVWEAAMSAAHFSVDGLKLDNLTAIIDRNGIQLDGWTKDIMNTEPLADKWRAFGWNVIETDGHDFGQIIAAFDKAKSIKGKPTVIIAKTVKGKGVSFMENKAEFHGKPPTKEQAAQALKELE